MTQVALRYNYNVPYCCGALECQPGLGFRLYGVEFRVLIGLIGSPRNSTPFWEK